MFLTVCRLTAPAVFRTTLLAKQGKLVLVHEAKLSCRVADLAEYVQRQVEAVTGQSMMTYIML